MRDALNKILNPSRLTAIIDIGANPIDGDPPYKNMLSNGLCKIIGFEPQPEALEKLRKNATEYETYLPYVLGDGEEHILHVCRASGMTSLLEPDVQRLKLFNLFDKFGEVIKTIKTETIRLDDVNEIENLDFLKIDVQGSELMIFSNGLRFLNTAVAIQTEVSFVPRYVGQPSFGQIDNLLRESGFIPHCFMAIKRWALSPTVFNGNPRIPGNQLLQADIVYVKDFANMSKVSSEKIKHLAMLSHHVFRSYDLVNLAIRELEKRGEVKPASITAYLSSITNTNPKLRIWHKA